MADEEGASSSEKTWDKGPPSPLGDNDASAASQTCTGEDCRNGDDNTDSSIELKSGVIPVYDDVSTPETKGLPPRSSYNANDDGSVEERIVTPTGSPPNGVNQDDLNDSGVSQGDPSQVNDSIMQDNMQDIEDRKPTSPELGSDISAELGTDSYAELGSPAFVRTSVERAVEATVSETEQNGNLGLLRLGSSSRESLSGSCDSNANIKGVDRTGMTRTLSDSQFTARDVQSQDGNASDRCSPNRTENGDIGSESLPLENPRQRLRSESEPVSQELLAKVERRQKISRINPAISLSVQSINDAMSPPASPTHSPMGTPQMRPKSSPGTLMSFIDRKVQEILDTESSYVKDLEDITQHYQQAMEDNKELKLSSEDFNTLFGNLQAVHRFNKELLSELEKCNNDAVEIAECFLEKERDFSVYTDYCTNYPKAVEVLTKYTKNPQIAEFFKICQTSLGHALPLGAYLLKPVQRVLKYHLLFQDMHKHFNVNAEGYDVIQDALDCMTYVARHINEMKRKHEVAVHVQEIQSQMIGLERDLNSYGDLVLEDVFRLQGARAERYLYLFEKVLLIGKKREDGLVNVKTHISCSNLMLIDSIQKEPLGFNVIPFDNPTIQYTILTKNQEQKKLWTHEIKRMILENYGSNIPTKVKELILKTTTPEPGQTPPQEGEHGLSRDKKERRSRRKKRRNSEPMNKLLRTTPEPSTAMTKLQRGQRQVKAVFGNIIPSYKIPGMRRPSIVKRGSELAGEVLTDDSLDQDEGEHSRLKQQSMEDLANVKRNISFSDQSRTSDSTSQDKRSLDGTESPRSLNRHSMELDVSFSTLSEEDQEPRRITRSRGTKESNRDSGIGSMTLSEHLKLDLDDRGSTDGERAEAFTEEKSEAGDASVKSHRRKDDSFSKDDTEDDDDEEEDPVKALRAIDSPDELEALETLDEKIDPSFIDKGGTIDIDSLHAWSAGEQGISPMSPKSDEAFKLRYNIRNYKRMSSSSQGSQPEDDDVWVKMPPRTYHGARGWSPQLSGHRPLSAEVAGHPHFAKLPLHRSSSENFKHLEGVNEFHLRTLSDPNILDSQIDKNSDTSSSKNDRSTEFLDSSVSTLGASDELSLSSTSSHEENLLESVNSAFKRLGQKYALQSGLLSTREEDSKIGTENNDNDQRQSRRDAISKTKKKVKITERKTHIEDAESVRSTHRSEATINVSVKVPESKKDKPLPLPKRTVRKLAREYSRRAKSLERPSTLLKHQSEPFMDTDFSIEEDNQTGSESLVLTQQPKGDLARKVQSLQEALAQSQAKVSKAKDDSAADLYHATPVLLSDSSTSDDDKNRIPMQSDSAAKDRKTVRDKVSQYECLSPKRNLEAKVITPNSGLSIQQRLRTIQESSDCRRSKSVDRSHFDKRRTSPSRSSPSRTGSPMKSLRERKLELEEWATRPITRGRYKSEGAFLGMACSDAISNSSNSDERDREVFSSRSSRTSSVQSSESASPLPPRKGIARRWSSHSSSLSEEESTLFKSIKDRFKELEKAASKPVKRTCQSAKEEIQAIARAETISFDFDIDYDMDSTQQQTEQSEVEDEMFPPVDASTVEIDSCKVELSQESESFMQEDNSSPAAEPETSVELQEVIPTVEQHENDTQDAESGITGDVDTLKRSRAEKLMRELDMLSMSAADICESGTLKHSNGKDSNMHKELDTESCTLKLSDQTLPETCNTETKDIPIEEDPRSTSTQYSLEDDEIPIEQSHMMDHNYQSTSSDDTCVPMRVTSKVKIDRDTRSEGGLSPERKQLPLERVLSSDSNIFLDAKSDLGGSEDSSSQSGFVTPVESFSQD